MTLKSIIGNEDYNIIERNRVLYNWDLSVRIEEERTDCKTRKMTDEEMEMYGVNKH
jgi:hypothetical protein